ncbi:MAG: hypothetical protein K2X41_11400 [Hyphomicrobium sp.]|nr:hypothetical protein [Hyphomicrobium sp.]
MASTPDRIVAVIAALEKIRDYTDGLDINDTVSTTGYNRWITMLESSADTSWANLKLTETDLPAGEYVMHLDAAIAFLTTEHSSS